MRYQTLGWLMSAVCVLCLSACGSKGGPQASDAHLNRAQAKGVFPSVLGSFAQGGFKVEEPDAGCAQYKSDYLRGQKSVKVVIHDCLPDGSSDWDELTFDDQLEGEGFPTTLAKDGQSKTLMVRVGTRFRVDFKSRNLGEDALLEVAQSYNWSKLKGLSGL